MADNDPGAAVVVLRVTKKELAELLNAHRPSDDRSDHNTPMCSCDHDLGWHETWGEHVVEVLTTPTAGES